MSKIYDLIIIGGGPAGLMAANVAQQRNLRYLIISENILQYRNFKTIRKLLNSQLNGF